MSKLFQYTRRASQRRLLAFELSRRYESAPVVADRAGPAADAAVSTSVVEGKALRGRVSDAEYTAN
ncbi:hypothetical protein GCM10023144_37560 [Pigmentiphaga soli]|uniref:Uncharacterized protein n=1 Tax=Pigmentiphaga soli TaxID=1007095 RepID=A0ABP8HHF3_9BURK